MKKIAVNTMKSFLKENKREDVYTKEFYVGDSSFVVSFHTSLTVAEKSTFLNRVVSGCFDTTGKFRPEYVSPMMRATILQMCTNIPAMTLKNETDQAGSPALDVDAMNELYLAMDLDHVQSAGYQEMLSEMTCLCGQAIDWKKSSILSSQNTDMDTLMQYVGILSDGVKELGESGILHDLLGE